MTEPPPYTLDRELLELECSVEAVRASGPGGQHRNRRETGIRLSHLPSEVVVMATERRSRKQNLEAAYERLIERLAELSHVPVPRVATKVPKRAVRARLASKRRASTTKAQRRPPTSEE